MKALVLLIAVLPAVAASAATLQVNTAADDTIAADSRCTLREAIANVNAATDTTSGDCAAGTGAGDTIGFTFLSNTKIKLKMGQLAIAKDVTIEGPQTSSLEIDGFHGGWIFQIQAGKTSMSDLTIRNGRASPGGSDGGGILVDSGAILALSRCIVTHNSHKAMGHAGGGIENSGTLSLSNCSLVQNVADSGGGLANMGTATLTNCSISRNSATNVGGGIFNLGTITLINSTLSRNRLSRHAGGGGALENQGAAALINCTLSGNTAPVVATYGGNGGNVSFTNCTLIRPRHAASSGVTGVGIFNDTGTVSLTNTIVTGDQAAQNCLGPITSNGNNLSSDLTCAGVGNGDLINTDPHLASLRNYGGPTETVALCVAAGIPARCTAASPAIDAGSDAVTGPPESLTTDQRGLPRAVGLHTDIGAYEVQ